MLSFIYKKINEKDFVLDAKNIDIFSEELEYLLSKAALQHEDLLKLRLLTETVLQKKYRYSLHQERSPSH